MGGAIGRGDMGDYIFYDEGSTKLGGSSSGSVDGGVFAQANDNIVEAAVDLAGSAGGWVSANDEGQIGRNSYNGA